MRVAVASDHAGFKLKAGLMALLTELGDEQPTTGLSRQMFPTTTRTPPGSWPRQSGPETQTAACSSVAAVLVLAVESEDVAGIPVAARGAAAVPAADVSAVAAPAAELPAATLAEAAAVPAAAGVT